MKNTNEYENILQDLPEPTILIKKTNNTKNETKKETKDQNPNTGTTEKSTNEHEQPILDVEDPEPLTPAQIKVKMKLVAFYGTIAVFISSRDMYDGMLIAKTSEQRAEEMVRAFRTNKRLWNFLVKFLDSGVWSSFFIGHVVMIYAILAHHGRIKADNGILTMMGLSEEQILSPYFNDLK